MKQNVQRITAWLALGLLLGLAGCAVNPEVRTTSGQQAALIVGYFDMSQAPFELECVRITQDEKAGIAYRQSCMKTLPNGLFFMENVPAMRYHIPFFYAGNKLHMISAKEQDAIQVRGGSIHFVGAYKYGVVARDLSQVLQIRPEQYTLKRVGHPNEQAVLRMLLPHVQDPQWKRRVQARLGK